MKKSKVLIAACAVLVVGAAGATLAVTNGKDKKSPASSTEKTWTDAGYTTVKACQAFTLNHAKQVLGESAAAGTDTPDTSTADVTVSSCTYTTKGTAPKDIRIATFMARSARTQAGAASNAEQFTSARPAGVQEVNGIGEMAFYDSKLGQLNFLKANNWFIMSVMGTMPGSASLESAKKAAELIILHL